jgi:hypothetical protein
MAAVVVGAAAWVAAEQAVKNEVAKPPPRLLSDAQVATLTVLAVASVIASVVVGISAGAGWWVVPLLLWAAALISTRNAARHRQEALRQRAAAARRQQEELAKNTLKEKRQRTERLAAARRNQEEKARMEEKQRVEALGKQGAALVNRAKAAVRQIMSTEAARDGWLGDIEFAPDIEEIEVSLLKAHALQGKSNELSALPKPSDGDRKIIAEVKTTTARLGHKAKERVELLEKCASEARLIDKSLREEREEAQLAEKREELHGELAAMLYGIEAIPETPSGSTADAVMARVQAYREIKRQIERARDDGDDNDSARDADTETGDHSPVSAIVASFHQAWKWVFD